MFFSQFSINISHYLQIEQVETSFSGPYQGVYDIFALKALQCFHFPVAKHMKELQ